MAYQKLGGLNNPNIFFFTSGEAQNQGWLGLISVCWELYSWLIATFFLCVHITFLGRKEGRRGREEGRERVFFIFIKPPILMGYNSTFMISFSFNYFLKA